MHPPRRRRPSPYTLFLAAATLAVETRAWVALSIRAPHTPSRPVLVDRGRETSLAYSSGPEGQAGRRESPKEGNMLRIWIRCRVASTVASQRNSGHCITLVWMNVLASSRISRQSEEYCCLRRAQVSSWIET
ncbi:uncharacterized protein LAESUDRAFT_527552 [Laetiporus sulphureus 93-53]|uniref:Secreted protein n=1 Tax=Laetiporus sulphureus 93-53 TaxID=1314785 RepID=A0A165BCE4_9APHY|nr:uncharacterized protein LAESUDRAFT_527552 [Laetiporus sulphureus 93-53]KZT00732.1 hypothetical protein LAESUDRAFT_527552 [Laetiporus sulphureus 93-53]